MCANLLKTFILNMSQHVVRIRDLVHNYKVLNNYNIHDLYEYFFSDLPWQNSKDTEKLEENLFPDQPKEEPKVSTKYFMLRCSHISLE